jgi:hypothetical protein
MASFPGAIKTFATLVDFVDTYLAAHNNERGDEITAIETELGTDVAGSATDLKTRLIQSLAADGDLEFASATELTIATGAITITQNWHTIDTQADAASDELDTINGGAEGKVLFLRPDHTDRSVVIKHNTGNILIFGNADLTLDDSHDLALLIYDAGLTKWLCFAAGGTPLSTTGSIPLPAGSWLPTSDVASWASAQLQVKQSSAGVPSPRWLEWLFDDTTDEHVVIHFTVPADYSSAPVLRVKYKCTSATSGTVAFEARVCALSPDDAADADADAYDTVNSATETVPGTAGYESIIDITLTNADSLAAGDEVNIALNRDVSADSVTGDIEVRGAQFRYTRA